VERGASDGRRDTLSKAQAVQAQIDALSGWIAELDENFDDDLGRIERFDYSANLAAALELHGIEDPNTALYVFLEREQALRGLLSRV
jgi:hypothetical protein